MVFTSTCHIFFFFKPPGIGSLAHRGILVKTAAVTGLKAPVSSGPVQAELGIEGLGEPFLEQT